MLMTINFTTWNLIELLFGHYRRGEGSVVVVVAMVEVEVVSAQLGHTFFKDMLRSE